MNSTLSKVFIFVTGAAIGSVVTWKLVKDKYAREAREDIEEIREYYKGKEKDEDEPLTDEDCIITEAEAAYLQRKQEREDYNKLVNEYYTVKETEENTIEMKDKPYIIPPDDYGMFDDYETYTFTYYGDQVLANELDEIIENVDEVVGEANLTTFGMYEDDAIYVRNENLKVDYEILQDDALYHDLFPDLAEGE